MPEKTAEKYKQQKEWSKPRAPPFPIPRFLFFHRSLYM
jgi:hypothetical protein